MSKSFLNYTINWSLVSRIFTLSGVLLTISGFSQSFPFKLDSPDKVFQLDNQLLEISGICMMPQDSVIIAEQDEAGIIYYLDKNTGKIIRQTSVESSGDFEDIAYVHPYIYLIKSKGILYRIKHDNHTDIKTFTTNLGKEDDIEGMTYDSGSKQLLVACKASKNPQNMYEREIYKYDLNINKLSNKPFIIISREAIINFLSDNKGLEGYEKLSSNYNKNNLEFHFGPSGIAIDPINKDLYIISSIGKILLVYDTRGKLKDIVKLDKDNYAQPEGITFDSKGNLYISNEGKAKKGTPGNILYFKRK